MTNQDKATALLNINVSDRTEDQTAQLRKVLRKMVRSFSRGGRTLLNLVCETPQGAVRIEGTDSFKITIQTNPGKTTSYTFDNSDLRPLVVEGAATVKALGNGVALISITELGKVCRIHF